MKSIDLDKVSIKEIELPYSKSISNRLLILKALINDNLEIKNLSQADDSILMKGAIEKMSNYATIDVQNAGTCFRFLTAFFALKADKIILKGTKEMHKRPIKILVDALQKLGAEINYIGEEGYPPIEIVGRKLTGGDIRLKGNVSSQYISALCLIGPFIEKELTLEIEKELKSVSYIDMTINLMRDIGIETYREEKKIFINPFKKINRSVMEVESDWSSASYWYEYLSFCEVGEELLLKGLKKNSIQGDSVVQEIFRNFGIQTYFNEFGARIVKGSITPITHFTYNFSSVPDIVQTMVLTCLGNKVEGRFEGVSHLRYKETDRIQALENEVRKLGGEIVLTDKDTLVLKIVSSLPKDVHIKTYQDHRMAMSFAPLVRKGLRMRIEDPDVVKKSYPTFWNHFNTFT